MINRSDIPSENPWYTGDWDEVFKSIDDSSIKLPDIEDIEEILYSAESPDDWDGIVVFVAKINDGRFMAYESTWGPTGSGFSEDAYGGDAEVWFGKDLNTLILQALTDTGRRLVGIPETGLSNA